MFKLLLAWHLIFLPTLSTTPDYSSSGLDTTSAAESSGSTDSIDEFEIKLRGIDGKSYDLTQMRGRVVVASFGATWCKPCEAELVVLEEVKKEYAGRGVEFLWISIETDFDIKDKDLRSYAKKRKISFPVLRDLNRLTYAQFSDRIKVPMVVFFDREGRVDSPIQFGMATHDLYKRTVSARLDKLLNRATTAATPQRSGAQNNRPAVVAPRRNAPAQASPSPQVTRPRRAND